MKNAKIHYLLLDLGDVLIEVDWQNAIQQLGTDTVAFDKIRFSTEHDLYERNQMSSDDFFTYIRETLNLDMELDKIEAAWCSVLSREVSGIRDVLMQLRERHQQKYNEKLGIYILSNTNVSHIQFMHKSGKFGFLSSIDHIIASYDLQYRKPELQIYQKALEIMKAKPTEVLFFDDKIENVEAAQQLGIRAEVCYRSSETMLNKLDELNTQK